MPVGGAIVVFAKCPIAGASKTRLVPLLGDKGAAALARAMLSDILVALSECKELKSTLKILMYAPGTHEAESQMISILESLNLPLRLLNSSTERDIEQWNLLPMISSTQTNSVDTQQSADLTSSSLGNKLIDALERTREILAKNTKVYQQNESVLFLGMDSPEIPIKEVLYGLQVASGHSMAQGDNESDTDIGKAHLCPANDGGYGLLSVPVHAPSSIFSGVRWSNHLTAVSQLKSLTDAGVDVSIGKLMFDIDEPDDVHQLASRLKGGERKLNSYHSNDVLSRSSGSVVFNEKYTVDKTCPFTYQTLIDLNILN